MRYLGKRGAVHRGFSYFSARDGVCLEGLVVRELSVVKHPKGDLRHVIKLKMRSSCFVA